MNRSELTHLIRTFTILSENLSGEVTDFDRRNLLTLVNTERTRLVNEAKGLQRLNNTTPPTVPVAHYSPFRY